jgi:hypothetical protein
MSTMCKTIAAGCAVGAALGGSALGAPDAPGARPGDEAMTCEQLATEIAPYVQQMQPNLQALATSQQQQYAQGRQRSEERKAAHELMTPLATAGALDPTGASKRAYQAAVIAQAAKEKAENEADANSPLAKQADEQRGQLATQSQQMRDDARLQRLMMLGRQKGCDKKR